MKILVLGGDGYLGWPTALYFSNRGHDVTIIDNLAKRHWEMEMGVTPLVSIPAWHRRQEVWQEVSGKTIEFTVGDIAANPRMLYRTLGSLNPDVIIHYAEQPSAPYSMHSREKAVYTQQNNVLGTLNLLFGIKSQCPDAHLIKLGTMGEYGTPNIDIEEGFIEVSHNGRRDRLPFPKQPGSFYHLTKVHDSHNIMFACKIWGLRSTDLNQGVVYGIDTHETRLHPDLRTSFHYDAIFGTALNRFCIQAAAGHPLTVYGQGGQTRGYLNILDTLQCVELAAVNRPKEGEYRVFNQFTELFSVQQLAEQVQAAGKKLGLDAEIDHIDNPRVEMEDHYYNPKHTHLLSLGLKPHMLDDVLLDDVLKKAIRYRDNVDMSQLDPKIRWRTMDITETAER